MLCCAEEVDDSTTDLDGKKFTDRSPYLISTDAKYDLAMGRQRDAKGRGRVCILAVRKFHVFIERGKH